MIIEQDDGTTALTREYRDKLGEAWALAPVTVRT